MSADRQPLWEILAGPPDEADYDVICAELMATPRGRWFLNEYAGRNRFADTHMLAGAIARVEAAVRGEPVPQVPAALAREITDLALAIGRIEDEIAARVRPASEGFPAAERIQDVAFALREREVDAELCDVLEAAIRDLGEVFARGDAAAERAHKAIALLRELKSRVHALVADAIAGTGVAPAAATYGGTPSATIADDDFGDEVDVADASLAECSAADAQADEDFAAMIGALAASFPGSDEQAGPAPEPFDQSAGAVSPPADAAEPEAGFEPANREPPADVGQKGEDVDSVEQLQPAQSNTPALSETQIASVGEPLGSEAAAQRGFEPAGPASEEATPTAVPEPQVHEPAIVQQRDAEELAGEDRVAESAATEPVVDEIAVPDRPVDEVAENSANEGLADRPAVTVDVHDAADEAAIAMAAADATDDRGPVSELATQPTSAASSAANSAELPAAALSVPAPCDGEREEGLAQTSDEGMSRQASGPEHSDASAGEALPPPDLPAAPSADAAPLSTTDLPATDLTQAVLAEVEVAASDDPAREDGLGEPEPREGVALTVSERTEHAADYTLGSIVTPDGEGAERLQNTAEGSISESTGAPVAAADPAVPSQAETSQHLLPNLQASGPEEDPGDLFEPLPALGLLSMPTAAEPITHEGDADVAGGVVAAQSDVDVGAQAASPGERPPEPPQDARAPATTAQTNNLAPAAAFSTPPSSQMRLALESPAPQAHPRAAALPMARDVPRPAPSDGLAPLRALSEEELIALFS